MQFSEIKADRAMNSGGVVDSLHASTNSITLSDQRQTVIDVVLCTTTYTQSQRYTAMNAIDQWLLFFFQTYVQNVKRAIRQSRTHRTTQ